MYLLLKMVLQLSKELLTAFYSIINSLAQLLNSLASTGDKKKKTLISNNR